MDIQNICNWIVLISATTVAISTIYKTFKKPVDSIQQKQYEQEDAHIKEIVSKERDSMLEDIKSIIAQTLTDSISELKQMVHDQQDEIKAINTELKLVGNAQKDLMRFRLSQIYYQYLPYHKIKVMDKKLFNNFYQDYHSLKGNSWIEEIKQEVDSWIVVEDNYNFSEKDLF